MVCSGTKCVLKRRSLWWLIYSE